jgi:hypothetical protein
MGKAPLRRTIARLQRYGETLFNLIVIWFRRRGAREFFLRRKNFAFSLANSSPCGYYGRTRVTLGYFSDRLRIG